MFYQMFPHRKVMNLSKLSLSELRKLRQVTILSALRSCDLHTETAAFGPTTAHEHSVASYAVRHRPDDYRANLVQADKEILAAIKAAKEKNYG